MTLRRATKPSGTSRLAALLKAWHFSPSSPSSQGWGTCGFGADSDSSGSDTPLNELPKNFAYFLTVFFFFFLHCLQEPRPLSRKCLVDPLAAGSVVELQTMEGFFEVSMLYLGLILELLSVLRHTFGNQCGAMQKFV